MSIDAAKTSHALESYQLDLFGMLRRKFWAIFFFVLLGLGLATLYYFKMPKTFRSESKIVIEERQQAPSLDAAEGKALVAQTPVEKYVEILTSEAVLLPAINNGKFFELLSFQNTEEEILEIVRENLQAKAKDTKTKSPGVINLSYDSPVQEESQKILQQIVAEFDSFIESSASSLGDNIMKTSLKHRDEIEIQLKAIDERIAKISNLPNLQFRDGHVVNQHQEQQLKLQTELDEIRRQRTRIEARMNKMLEAKTAGIVNDEMALDALLEINDGSLGAYVITHQEFVKLVIEEQKLIAQFGAEHPELVNIRAQIERVDRLRRQELAAIRGNRDENVALVDVVIAHMQNRIDINKAEETSLQQEILEEQKKASAINQDVLALESLQQDRTRLSNNLGIALDRLKGYDALREFNWRELKMLDPPSAGEQYTPNLLISLAVGLILGGMLGVMYASIKEFAEKTFHSSEQIAQVLGTPVLAHVQKFSTRFNRENSHKDIATDVISIHRPESPWAESYRTLRTAMFFRAQKSKAKVLQITSPLPSDGKSTTAANVAVVIAQAGRSVVLVDCDLRRPTQHKRFYLDNDKGITSVIAGEMSPDEAMYSTSVDNLTLLPSGPLFTNPSELLSSDGFQTLIQYLRDRFEFVIIDSPPVLPVTDPCIIANFVDGVYVTIRIRNGVQVNAQHSIEALETVGAPVCGIIVNGIQPKDAKTYQYGEGYGYGRNRYGRNNAYYTSDAKTKGKLKSRARERDPAEAN
ncbi:MAG: polysaccharide biosynthesis tyrosine autokinase [Pirellulaceae bacterium]